MRDDFIPMREALFAAVVPPCAEVVPQPDACETPLPADRDDAEIADALGEVRRFRAALADAIEFRSTAVFADIVCEVLGRELLLAPADIAAIVRRRVGDEREIVRVRVHPCDAPYISHRYRAVHDTTLRRGDAIVETAEDTIDARLGVRLSALLERCDW